MNVAMAPSPMSSVSKTSVTRMLALLSMSLPGPTVTSVDLFRTIEILPPPSPFSSITLERI